MSKIKTLGFIAVTSVLLTFSSSGAIAKTPYNTTFAKLQKSGKIHNSTNIQRARWIVTDLEWDKKNHNLKIKNYFQNDRRTTGFTGCASVKIFAKSGDILFEHTHERGVNSKVLPNHRATMHAKIDLSEFKDDLGVLSIINVKQWHCSKGFWIRTKRNLKDLTKKGAKVAGDVIVYEKAIRVILGK